MTSPPPNAAGNRQKTLAPAATPAAQDADRQLQEADGSAAAPARATYKTTDPQDVTTRLLPFPEALCSFHAFRKHYWIDAAGDCTEAPWADSKAFADRLRAAQKQALGLGELHRVWVYARTLELLGAAPVVTSAECEELDGLWCSGATRTALDSARSQRLSGAAFDGWSEEEAETLQVSLFLELVSPSPGFGGLQLGQLENLVSRAFAGDIDLRDTLLAIARLGMTDRDPVLRMRERLEAHRPVDREAAARRLQEARTQLQAAMLELWSAAGGRIKTTHCRKAWQDFMGDVGPALREMANSEMLPAGAPQQAAGMLGRFTEIADAAGARFEDRNRMERAARRLATLANALVESSQILVLSAQQPVRTDTEVDITGAQRLFEEESRPGAGASGICRRIMARLLQPRTPTPPSMLDLPDQELRQSPHLLAGLRQLGDRDEAAAVGREMIEDARVIAAHMLSSSGRPVPIDGQSDLPADLVSWCVSAKRHDLAVPLLPALQPEHRREVDNQIDASVHAVREMLVGLRATWKSLDDLAAEGAQRLHEVMLSASDLIEEMSAARRHRLIASWIDRVVAYGREARRATLAGILAAATPEQAAAITEASAAERWSDVLFVLHGQTERRHRPLRETSWRVAAAAQFKDPRAALKEAASNGGPKELIESWLTFREPKARAATSLRNGFARFVFEQLVEESRSSGSAFRIECSLIRRRINETRANPSFVPQLGSFTYLAVLTSSEPVNQKTFVRKTADGVANQANTLAIVLAPGITRFVREQILEELRHRGAPAAVVDDIDLLRLINPSVNPMLGLLEIALEQQRWSERCPFRIHEGQNVEMEMYVGRRADAEKIVISAAYSRLFSGRKLGKSALLKFIEQTYNKTRLPSGSTLRVLYVPIAGAETEIDVTQRILRAMQDQLGFKSRKPPRTHSGRLERALLEYLDTHATESLLIVLDEADAFVEAQLLEYDRVREACLSFRMRTNMSATDETGFPRVRFLFSGYRATQTSSGAWANWGDVLRLSPLEVDEACELIEGPLARLGIDAGAQAPLIAWRCGYQPAVIIRFGMCLVDHLERTWPPARRETTQPLVTPDDVASVIAQTALDEEIRTVVRNNFPTDRPAWVVFLALLLELAELPPGQGLEDAPARILARLQSVDPDLSWLHGGIGSAHSEIANKLREFEQRRLMVRRVSGNEEAYTLRCPHHLPVLRKNDPESEILEEVRALKRGGTTSTSVRSLLTKQEFEEIRFAYKEADRELKPQMIVVGSTWVGPLQDRTRGLADLLGIEESFIWIGARGRDFAKAERLVVHDASPEVAREILSSRGRGAHPALLIGGLDLLRWALDKSARAPADAVLEIAGLGRIPEAALTWWFERVRCYEFTDAQAIARIHRSTSGIPVLVREVDTLLKHGDGEHKSRAEVDRILEQLPGELPRIAQELTAGAASERLLIRELQLLRMCAAVADEFGADADPRDALADAEYAAVLGKRAGAPPVSEADHVPLSLLQRVGLVPVRTDAPAALPFERLAAIGEEDALHDLLAQMQA